MIYCNGLRFSSLSILYDQILFKDRIGEALAFCFTRAYNKLLNMSLRLRNHFEIISQFWSLIPQKWNVLTKLLIPIPWLVIPDLGAVIPAPHQTETEFCSREKRATLFKRSIPTMIFETLLSKICVPFDFPSEISRFEIYEDFKLAAV